MLLTLSVLPFQIAFAEYCTSDKLSKPEQATVKWVYDGDTLQLTDKRKIRIIGIDTPEVKHHRQKAQAYGAKAREALRELLKKNDYQIFLRYGIEKKDKYSRFLAHVFTPDGINISSWLLEKGFARSMNIPPNVLLADCYKVAEESAQSAKLRIWRYKRNSVRLAESLPKSTEGYVRLQGTISKINHYKKSLILELKSNSKRHIRLKIAKKNFHYFKKLDPAKLWNQTIEVSGVLRNKRGKRTLYLNHPSQIKMTQAKRKVPAVAPTIQWSSQNDN